MSSLESELSVSLFHRHARGLILTEQGELLYRTAHDVFMKLEAARTKLTDSRERPNGELKVSTTPGIGVHWLTPRLGEFHDLYPDIQVTLITSDEELDHDFMWRCTLRLPERGRIGIFNRSYYEEVLVVRVRQELLANQKIPARLVGRRIWRDRFEDIGSFERYLARNGVLILKFFLHVSKEEQERRFLERLEDPRKHWAFQPPERPAVPTVVSAAWVRNPIDAFLAAEHERLGLIPVAEAEKIVLLRRVHLDLIGLPPTPDELRAFLADTSPDAYERVVERLLASPQYGERWGRHWMDVWRYSDWDGFGAEIRGSQRHVWRWRDCQERTRRIVRAGGWTTVSGAGADRDHCRGAGGSTFRYRFSGPRLEIRLGRGTKGGKARVYVDGERRKNLGFHGDGSLRFGKTRVLKGLGKGKHTLRLETRGGLAYLDSLISRD